MDSDNTPLKDLLAKLSLLVEKLTPGERPKENWFQRWANTPFVVTLLGGIIGTGLTLTWKGCEAKEAKETASRIAQIDARRRAFDTFVNHFPGSLMRLYDYQYHWLWLGTNPTNSVDESGRTWFTIQSLYETARVGRVSNRLELSFPAEISGTFSDTNVLVYSRDLEKHLGEMFNATNSESLDISLSSCNGLYTKLIRLMSEELMAIQE